MKKTDFLLINPCIYDFAAYDFWVKPLGLYNISGILHSAGFSTRLIDCLDADTFLIEDTDKYRRPQKKLTGEGKFIKQQIEKPAVLKNIKRKYSRYGIPVEAIRTELTGFERPKAVLITSMMTYWYPALFDTVRLIKEIYPGIPVLLGGVYATLCRPHALQFSGADRVISGAFDQNVLKDILSVSNISESVEDINKNDFFSGRLNKNKGFASILTSRGCPYRCNYCASKLLYPAYVKRPVLNVLEELDFHIHENQITDITFYDDALLVDPEDHIKPILRQVLKSNYKVRFHVPNGLHMRNIDEEIADLMIKTGFKTLRFGFEYSDQKRQRSDGKITNREFNQKINILKQAGFSDHDIGINIMAGMPKQTFVSAFDTVKFIQDIGLKIYVSEFSPIPGTGLWPLAVVQSKYDILNEPLFHNNSLFPCQWEGFTLDQLNDLKVEARKSGRSAGSSMP